MRPVRRAVRAASALSDSGASAFDERNAARTPLASREFAATVTCTMSGGRLRNAIPRPTERTIGNASDQKRASGSRTNSRKRVSVSCRSESRIAQVPPGERDEDVLERRGVGAQLGDLHAFAFGMSEHRWQRATQLLRRELVAAVVDACVGDGVE